MTYGWIYSTASSGFHNPWMHPRVVGEIRSFYPFQKVGGNEVDPERYPLPFAIQGGANVPRPPCCIRITPRSTYMRSHFQQSLFPLSELFTPFSSSERLPQLSLACTPWGAA